MSEAVNPEPQKTKMKVKVLYYPFMGTDIDTERLILLARICYAPMGIDLSLIHI